MFIAEERYDVHKVNEVLIREMGLSAVGFFARAFATIL
jgi:hypothetical protein